MEIFLTVWCEKCCILNGNLVLGEGRRHNITATLIVFLTAIFLAYLKNQVHCDSIISACIPSDIF